MSETATWTHLRDKMAPRLHMERITEKLSGGVPDVIYLTPYNDAGWVELKYLKAYPKTHRASLLKAADLRADQVSWLLRWARKGGTSGVLLHVGSKEWVYWRTPAVLAWKEAIYAPVDEALAMASAHWVNGFEPGDMFAALTADLPAWRDRRGEVSGNIRREGAAD